MDLSGESGAEGRAASDRNLDPDPNEASEGFNAAADRSASLATSCALRWRCDIVGAGLDAAFRKAAEK